MRYTITVNGEQHITLPNVRKVVELRNNSNKSITIHGNGSRIELGPNSTAIFGEAPKELYEIKSNRFDIPKFNVGDWVWSDHLMLASLITTHSTTPAHRYETTFVTANNIDPKNNTPLYSRLATNEEIEITLIAEARNRKYLRGNFLEPLNRSMGLSGQFQFNPARDFGMGYNLCDKVHRWVVWDGRTNIWSDMVQNVMPKYDIQKYLNTQNTFHIHCTADAGFKFPKEISENFDCEFIELLNKFIK